MSTTESENIQALLDATGTTHDELGKVAGVSRSAVSHWINGSSVPRMPAIRRMADHFGINVSCIIEKDGMSGVSIGKSANHRRCAELANLYETLDDDGKRIVFEIVEYLAKSHES